MKRARLVALGFGALVLALSQLPHLWAVHAERRGYAGDKVYSGVLPTSAEDALSYYGWMREGAEGRFAMSSWFTLEPHDAAYINVFYNPLGWICRATGWSLPAVYAGARVATGIALFGTIWWFVGIFFDRPGPRLACYALAVLSGGWEGPYNWLVRNQGFERISSPGWWTPEISTFFSAMTLPHFGAAFTLMLLAVGFAIRGWQDPGRRAYRLAAASGGLLFLLAFFHPYEVVTCGAIFALAPALESAVTRTAPWRAWAVSAVAMACVAPAIAWNAWIFSENPAFRAMDLQGVMTTPEWTKLVLALGINGVLGVVAFFALPRMNLAQRAAAAWFVASLLAAQVPLRYQRRLLGGIQYPLAVLSTFVLMIWVLPALTRWLRGRKWVAVAVLAVVLLPLEGATPYYVRDIDWHETRTYRFPVWVPGGEMRVLRALEREGSDEDGVFCSHDLGMLVPGFAGVRTYVGHYSLTIDSDAKQAETRRFFDPATSDAWRRELLRDAGTGFLLWTARERELGAWDPEGAPWLSEIARETDDDGKPAILYRVLQPASPSPNP